MTNYPVCKILDINYVDFLQFQRYFIPQAELEEAFIYIIHKPIDFSYNHISLKQVRVPIVRGKALFGHISQMSTN